MALPFGCDAGLISQDKARPPPVTPPKASHTAAALDEHGRLQGQQRIPAALDGYQLLRQLYLLNRPRLGTEILAGVDCVSDHPRSRRCSRRDP
jgi:hypothetical protein